MRDDIEARHKRHWPPKDDAVPDEGIPIQQVNLDNIIALILEPFFRLFKLPLQVGCRGNVGCYERLGLLQPLVSLGQDGLVDLGQARTKRSVVKITW